MASPQHVHVAVFLREAFGESLPLVAAAAAAEDAQACPFVHVVFRIALDGNNVNRLRLVCVHVDGETKSVGRLPLTSFQLSPASSERITSQCFCMNSSPGARDSWRCGERSARLRHPGREYIGTLIRG